VIALGSPLSLENTATFRHITGVNRNFNIGSRIYDNMYQTSAAIAPGSSGAPLVSKKTGQVLAINSVKMNGQDAIGFSIPVKNINNLIEKWIKNPLSADEIQSLFYNESGELFYQEFWDDDAYFEDEEQETPEEEFIEEEAPDEYPDGEFEDPYADEEPADEFEDSEPYTEEMPPVSEPIIDDLNGDGFIDINDLTEDLNGDGSIDENDLKAAGIPEY